LIHTQDKPPLKKHGLLLTADNNMNPKLYNIIGYRKVKTEKMV